MLKDRIHGRVVPGSKAGPKPYLTNQEEKQLSHYLLEISEAGYGKIRNQVKSMVEAIAKEKCIIKNDMKIVDGWWHRFLERQPHLSPRKGDSTAAVRLAATTYETLQNYFGLLKKVLDENGLMDSIIANTQGKKKVLYRSSGNKACGWLH